MANVECNVGIICGSLPEIRPLFMRLFERRKADSSGPGAFQPSNPQSNRSPRNGGFPSSPSPGTETARQEKSIGSLDAHQWDVGQKSHQIITDTVYLETLSPEKMTARHDHRTSASGTDGSHGSDENWTSGGEVYPHPKNIPSSVL
jgi:hypothetical protein